MFLHLSATSLESWCIYHPGSLNAVLPGGQVRRQTQHNISIFSQQTNGSTEENKTDLSLVESRLIIKEAGSFFSHVNWLSTQLNSTLNYSLHIFKQAQFYWVALVFYEFKYKQINKNLTQKTIISNPYAHDYSHKRQCGAHSTSCFLK